MAKGFFITGTDTDVGKSYFGSQLVRQLFETGQAVQPRKPIESGCLSQNNELIPSDGMAYYQATKQTIPLEIITPYRYEPAIAPPQAMHGDNCINLEQITHAVYQSYKQNEILIVEGAGGFYSPLCIDANNADLAMALQLPILLVVGNKVGCINHCLLTIEAIVNKQLPLSAIILNDTSQNTELLEQNYQSIKALIQEMYPNLADKVFSMENKGQIPSKIANF